tara:strand:- start:1236 stop:2333 length:1098 start_codon:yes stop_codon:yes gene_type:complete
VDKKLAHLLGRYIEDLYPQIQELPMRVDKKTAKMFDFNPRQKLDVLFGPDIESLLWDDKELISQYQMNRETIKFIGAVKRDCKDFLFKSNKSDFDGEKIEVRLAPRDPYGIIKSFDHIKQSFGMRAGDLELHADFAITQHWHMSLNQDEKGWFSKAKQKSLFGITDRVPLTFSVISSLLKIQQEVPAFFVEPWRLEDSELNHHFTVKSIGKHFTSVRACHHQILQHKYHTVEPRFGVNDAPQSIALYMAAVHWGVNVYPQYDLKKMADNSFSFALERFEGIDAFPNKQGDYMLGGKFAYLGLLEKTIQSEKIHEMLPRDVFNALVVDAAARYDGFLETRTAQELYSDAERIKLTQRCDRIVLDHS